MRHDNRQVDQLRPISFQAPYIIHHSGSVLVGFGNTKVLCCATWEAKVPPHRANSNGGWLTAEYNMLPGATHERKARPGNKGPDGRSVEIQRLIGRSLRQAINLDALGPKSITLDCDVIQADGGTRTAAITGAWLALYLCVKELIRRKEVSKPLEEIIVAQVAAVSVGVLQAGVMTDLCYEEDAGAIADANLVGTAEGRIIEFQTTAEKRPIEKSDLDKMLQQGRKALDELVGLQQDFLNNL